MFICTDRFYCCLTLGAAILDRKRGGIIGKLLRMKKHILPAIPWTETHKISPVYVKIIYLLKYACTSDVID